MTLRLRVSTNGIGPLLGGILARRAPVVTSTPLQRLQREKRVRNQERILRFSFSRVCANTRSGSEAQKGSDAIQLRLEFALEGTIARWMRFDVAEFRPKLAVLHGEVAPANNAVTPKQRQSVVPQLAFV